MIPKPSVALMEHLNAMMKPYAVSYYSDPGYYPRLGQEDPKDNQDISEYIKHYALNCYPTQKQREELPKYFWDDYRTFFGREYDRIICTNSFRRLQYKTQVMVNSASDEQRTRLLHSLEVQRIAKKIALGIGANVQLAENIAIAHDIGHAPFGHSGEAAISEYFAIKDTNTGKPIDDTAYFLHPIQSVKVVDKIATHNKLQEFDIDGLGLSDYVLEGILKHDSDVFSENIRTGPLTKQYNISHLCGIVGIGSYDDIIHKFRGKFELTVNRPETFIGSIESQIAAWADKIAYLGHDWEEFLDTKLLEKLVSRLNDMVHNMYGVTATIGSTENAYIISICNHLKQINLLYNDPKCQQDAQHYWPQVYFYINEIINDITIIEQAKTFEHFSKKGYQALKDFFAMVVSWVKLIEKYPLPQSLRNDPIGTLYMYLSDIRTTVITKYVTEKLIIATNTILNTISQNLNHSTREDYLLFCNEEWIHVYDKICKASTDGKPNKKQLKDSVRTCYLVQFGTEDSCDSSIIYSPNIVKRGNNGYYNFDDRYCCLLNIIGCIGTQYIKSTRVNFMTQQAKKIVTTLLDYYSKNPEMLPYSQRKRFKWDDSGPIKKNSDAMYAIVDYIAGMTDRMAKKKYDEIISSDTKWSNEYSNGLT